MEIRISGSFVEQSNKMTALFFPLAWLLKKINLQERKIFFVGYRENFPSFCLGCFHLSCTTYTMDTTPR